MGTPSASAGGGGLTQVISSDATRVVRGPLTTIFSPPASCYTPVLAAAPTEISTPSLFDWGYDCAGVPEQQCYPSSLSLAASYAQPFQVYSPAVGCPHSWTQACGASRIDESNAIGDTFLTTWMHPGEILNVCCPIGWFCTQAYETLGYTLPVNCVTANFQSDAPIVLTGRTCTQTATPDLSFFTSVSVRPPHGQPFGFGNAVALLTGATGAISQPTATPASGGSYSGTDAGSTGLSSRAVGGIAAGVAIASILLCLGAALLACLFRARRKRRAGSEVREPPKRLESDTSSAPTLQSPSQLEPAVLKAIEHKPRTPLKELDGHVNEELHGQPVSELQCASVHELDALELKFD